MEKLQDFFTNHPVLPESWLWVIFGIAVIVLLLWDLLFFNRKNEVPNFMHTLILCIIYILAALLFGVFVMYEEGVDKGMLFFTGFLAVCTVSTVISVRLLHPPNALIPILVTPLPIVTLVRLEQ